MGCSLNTQRLLLFFITLSSFPQFLGASQHQQRSKDVDYKIITREEIQDYYFKKEKTFKRILD